MSEATSSSWSAKASPVPDRVSQPLGVPAWAVAPSPPAGMLASGSSPSTAYAAARRRAFCSAPASRNAVIRSLGAQSMAPNSCAGEGQSLAHVQALDPGASLEASLRNKSANRQRGCQQGCGHQVGGRPYLWRQIGASELTCTSPRCTCGRLRMRAPVQRAQPDACRAAASCRPCCAAAGGSTCSSTRLSGTSTAAPCAPRVQDHWL